jgi:hypothetical protein
MNMAGKLQRDGASIEVRHVAEVLAGMTHEPAIGSAAAPPPHPPPRPLPNPPPHAGEGRVREAGKGRVGGEVRR